MKVRWMYDESTMNVRWMYDESTMKVRWKYDEVTEDWRSTAKIFHFKKSMILLSFEIALIKIGKPENILK